MGEIFAVRFSQDLFGPGSEIETCRDLPSRATRYNYHYAVLSGFEMDDDIRFTILPMPAYSAIDPVSGLSSTSWLLAQPDDFQRLHIPVAYEEDPTRTQPHPPFQTPAGFGLPLQIDGWKNTRPSWVQAVPQVTKLKETTMVRNLLCWAEQILTWPAQFKSFEPPVMLSKDELWRLVDYCKLCSPPVISSSSTRSDVATGDDIVPVSSFAHRRPCGNDDGGGPSAGTSLALQALYANVAVKHRLADLTPFSKPCDPDPDDDSDDDEGDDDSWEDTMDPITFARYYAATSLHLARIVQEHDRKMRTLQPTHSNVDRRGSVCEILKMVYRGGS